MAACCTVSAILAPLTSHWWLAACCALLATATTVWIALLRPPVDGPLVAALVGVVLAIAVMTPPEGSRDLWSYAMVGRTVVVHHANPYTSPPAASPSDPFLRRVATGWRHTTTPYGPAFVAYAAVVARVGGSHPLLERWGFQFAAALAVALALWLLWRATGATISVLLVVLHPVTAAMIVNGAHNDAFVGLGILAAVLFARSERFRAAGWALAGAMLVKLTAGLALLPVAAWAWARGGKRAAAEVCAPALGCALLITALVPGALRSVASADGGIVSRGSVWNAALQLHRWLAAALGGNIFAPVLTRVAVLFVTVVAVVAAKHAFRSREPVELDVAAATASWLFLGAYVLPWYAGWSLPVAALQPGEAITWLIVLDSGFLTASQAIPRSLLHTQLPLGLGVHVVIPTILLVAFVLAVLRLGTPVGREMRGSTLRAGGNAP